MHLCGRCGSLISVCMMQSTVRVCGLRAPTSRSLDRKQCARVVTAISQSLDCERTLATSETEGIDWRKKTDRASQFSEMTTQQQQQQSLLQRCLPDIAGDCILWFYSDNCLFLWTVQSPSRLGQQRQSYLDTTYVWTFLFVGRVLYIELLFMPLPLPLQGGA